MAQAPERFYQYQQVFAGGVAATEEAAKVDGIAKLDSRDRRNERHHRQS